MFLFDKSMNQLSDGSEKVSINPFTLDPFWIHVQDDCEGSQFYVGASFSLTLFKISCPVMNIFLWTIVRNRLRYYLGTYPQGFCSELKLCVNSFSYISAFALIGNTVNFQSVWVMLAVDFM